MCIGRSLPRSSITLGLKNPPKFHKIHWILISKYKQFFFVEDL